jgi:hypothetical protein
MYSYYYSGHKKLNQIPSKTFSVDQNIKFH